ncbi:MAG: hypothetical protein M9887_01140 [Chitinophagales bacterium]|nr:hypothetical protein [Chitinophagales bacterium]
MSHNNCLKIGFLIAVFYCFFFQYQTSYAQTVKKKSKKAKTNLIKKGWGDVTTRNNFYFNAKQIYDEMLKNHQKNAEPDYQQTLPFYFHDMPPSLKSQEQDLQKIIIKTGVVLQRHDFSRWRDNCYTLLGKAYFLKDEMDSALVNFQYVSTVLRGKFNDQKVIVSQKELLKAKKAKQKELDKVAKDKKKQIEEAQKEKAKDAKQAADDKTKRMDAAKKTKEKELQRKIKAKKKMLKQKAKGKYKTPAPSASTPPKTSPPKPVEKKKKSVGGILDKISDGISIDFDKNSGNQTQLSAAEKKLKALEAKKKNLEVSNVEDSLSLKERERMDKLSLWEKIKHLSSRPEALVWMTKTFIKKGDYTSAESIVEYSNTLLKLRKSQKKQTNLVKSYYYYHIDQIEKASEALEKSISYMKSKKEKNYYNFLLAQLISENNTEKSYDIYKQLAQKAKDEDLRFNALEKMYQYAQAGKVTSDKTSELIDAYHKFAKDKMVGDQALYRLAKISMQEKDTVKAVKYLNKSLSYIFSKDEQKSKALALLGDIAYNHFSFKDAYKLYDSAVVMMTKDTITKNLLQTKISALKEIVEQQDIAHRQDSLIYLSTLSRDALAQYIRQQNKVERKLSRKEKLLKGDDDVFFSQGIGNNTNFNTSQSQYTNNGKWYFYNIDLRTKGFNEFQQNWGHRPYVKEWRRGEAIILQNTYGVKDLLDQMKDTTDTETLVVVYRIPGTPEELEQARDLIATSYYNRAITFFEKLSDYKNALIFLDSLFYKYSEHRLIPDAYYTKMLIYIEMGDQNKADQMAKILSEKFPDHELTKKLQKANKADAGQLVETINLSGKAEEKYIDLYSLYKIGKFDEVIAGKADFLKRFPQEQRLLPKVSFLEALSLIKCGERDKYKSALENIVRFYANSEEAQMAKMYLKVLADTEKEEKGDTLSSTEKKEEIEEHLFKFEDDVHYIMILNKQPQQNNIELIKKINIAMDETFPNERIRGSNSYLDIKNPILLVKRFKNIEAAEHGMSIIKNSKDPDLKAYIAGSEILLISQGNFTKLFTTKKMDEYKKFYKEKY